MTDVIPQDLPTPISARIAPVIVITGMSGAGRSTALRALEDLGLETVDNLPLSVLELVVRSFDRHGVQGLAIGIDARSRGFAVERLLDRIQALNNDADQPIQTLFIDCDDDVLIRRYTETRRRHPLAADRPAADGIRLERQLLAPLRAAADLVLDTSLLTQSDLRRMVRGVLVTELEPQFTVTVLSFSFREGLPREADLVFDARFLRNPHYDPILRPLDGRDERIRDFITQDPHHAGFVHNLKELLEPLLPRYRAEGKTYLTIAVGCTGGRHRSVHIAETLATWLHELGIDAGLIHRDIGRDPARVAAEAIVSPTLDPAPKEGR